MEKIQIGDQVIFFAWNRLCCGVPAVCLWQNNCLLAICTSMKEFSDFLQWQAGTDEYWRNPRDAGQ